MTRSTSNISTLTRNGPVLDCDLEKKICKHKNLRQRHTQPYQPHNPRAFRTNAKCNVHCAASTSIVIVNDVNSHEFRVNLREVKGLELLGSAISRVAVKTSAACVVRWPRNACGRGACRSNETNLQARRT